MEILKMENLTTKEAFRRALIRDIEAVRKGELTHAALADAIMDHIINAVRAGELAGAVAKVVRVAGEELAEVLTGSQQRPTEDDLSKLPPLGKDHKYDA